MSGLTICNTAFIMKELCVVIQPDLKLAGRPVPRRSSSSSASLHNLTQTIWNMLKHFEGTYTARLREQVNSGKIHNAVR